MRPSLAGAALALALATTACHHQEAAKAPDAQTTEAAQAIAWREGDVDDAFAEAKENGKPVLLYWGAKWCPPCNQLKSTLFKDPAFIAQTRNFVPVYLDGDSKGAQAWGERFGISGYPTVIILRPDQSEVTRISSTSGGTALADLLRTAATRTMSFDQLLDKASKDPKSLTAEDWDLLADFDWGNDPKRFKDSGKMAVILDKLSIAAPQPAMQHRFALLALSNEVNADDDGKMTLTPAQQTKVGALLPAVLASSAEVTANRQELSFFAPSAIVALPDADQRKRLGSQLIDALDVVYANPSLPVADRLITVNADIMLGKGNVDPDSPTPPAVLAKVRQRVAWANKTAEDAMTRQSVISGASQLLDAAGDRPGAVQLLKAELTRSAEPYYYMIDLSSLAEESKDNKSAIDWAKRAAENAQGPATRLQWAIMYSGIVMRLAPDDKAAVEQSAGTVIAALNADPGDYYQRTKRKISQWGGQLTKWSGAHDGQDVLQRLSGEMTKACTQQGSAQSSCNAWLQKTA